MNFRADKRTPEQFEADIKSRTLKERELFLMWLALCERDSGHKINWRDTGIDNSGKLLSDSEVNSYPDFAVKDFGLVESKFAYPMLKDFFHIKVNQINNYIKLEASILMINGAETSEPQFTLIGPEAQKNIKLWCEQVRWIQIGGKSAYKIPINMFIWRPLK